MYSSKDYVDAHNARSTPSSEAGKWIQAYCDKFGGYSPYTQTEAEIRKHVGNITALLTSKLGDRYEIQQTIESAEFRPPFMPSWKLVSKLDKDIEAVEVNEPIVKRGPGRPKKTLA